MIKLIKENWEKYEKELKKEIGSWTEEDISHIHYETLAKLVFKIVFVDEFIEDKEMLDHLTVIDDGKYQGTLLFVIPISGYPCEYDYVMSHISYGSCTVCDTLESIRYNDDDIETQRSDLVSVCKTIACNIVRPYNKGWSYDPKFDEVERKEE